MPGPPTPQLLTVRRVNQVALVKINTPAVLDDDVIHRISTQLDHLLATDAYFVVDFAAVRSMSSMLIGRLLEFSKKVVKAGGGLAFCGISPKVLEVFKILKLDRVFHIFPTEWQAMEAIADPNTEVFPSAT